MSDDEAQAQQLRQEGNTLYKERKFEQAREAFERAWQLYPKDIAVLNNVGGEHRPAPRGLLEYTEL